MLYKLKNKLRYGLLYLVKRFLLEKHRFPASTLILKDGTRTLYEVDSTYYNKDLQPITIVRAYPAGSELIGISYHENLEFKEYRKPVDRGIGSTASDVATTPHDNAKFGKRSKK